MRQETKSASTEAIRSAAAAALTRSGHGIGAPAIRQYDEDASGCRGFLKHAAGALFSTRREAI
jgi:hypothetical protein